MFQHQKQIWLKIIEMYKEMTFLWDPKHKDYANQPMRCEAYDKLFEVYKKLDNKGTVDQMKKKIINFRTSYIKERNKKQQCMENGKDYTPTLWYYNHLRFLTDEGTPIIKKHVRDPQGYRFNRSNNKIYLEKETPGTRSLKRKRPNSNSTRSSLRNKKREDSTELEDKTLESSDEENNTETSQRDPSDEFNSLLERQTKLISSVAHILNKKEEPWAVQGKSIGAQLNKLEEKQRIIAHKLISDVIFYGGIGRLTMDSFVKVDSYGNDTPESDDMIKGHIEYLEPESPEYLENE